MTRFNFMFVLLLLPFTMNAQFGISANIGRGTYSMSGLKDYNSFLIYNYNTYYQIPLNRLENFPLNWNYSLKVFYETPKKYRFSIGYQYLTTQSRLNYEDLNSFVDQVVSANANSISISGSKELLPIPFISTGIFVTPQLLINNNILKGREKIDPNPETSETRNLNSINAGAEAGIFLRKRFSHFELSFDAGYYFDFFRGKISGGSGSNAYDLKNGLKNELVKNNWNGYRISLGTSYCF